MKMDKLKKKKRKRTWNLIENIMDLAELAYYLIRGLFKLITKVFD